MASREAGARCGAGSGEGTGGSVAPGAPPDGGGPRPLAAACAPVYPAAMVPPGHMRNLRLAVTLLALGALPHAGCHKEGRGAHYADPGAMIAKFEASDRDAWQMPDRVVRALPIPGKDAVLADIGAGSGYFTRRLAAEVPAGKVYAVEVEAEFERYIRENREAWGQPNIVPHLAHYEDPMLPTGAFDLVFTADTYSYLPDRPTYFKRVHHALKPGGHLAIVDVRPDAKPPSEAVPAPERRVPRDQVVREVEAAGFRLVREETFLPHQYFLIFQRTDTP